ncbi:prepilin-type N-terminal cleavage/methylation domain-containing protein [Lysobacter terrestris]|uniref:Prepilin-type N-terminal cleavage/methylation domain-containing protein n=2 Tax=Agrilutibacter terrestris TaxID=2865112 RepID=A0A7H0G195_9GAMM|nr:prepilin-type N-terminal cleavage/methylation domain-containing protein [Lysobacter terrestris]
MRVQRGFTLIELMIVVMVIAILAAIAIPNYLEQSKKGRRADAVRAVGEYQLEMERWRAECYTYAEVNTCKDTDGDGTVETGERGYPSAPTSSFYSIPSGGLTASETAYSITLQPSGKQAGDRCGNLVGNNTNKQKPAWSVASCNQ